MKQSKIGIFDSGIGGLYVLNEIYNKYPNCEYYYYGDTKNMPYGSKNIDELKEYGKEIIEYFNSVNVDLVVCACGTMSTNILGYLNDISVVPVLSVIDPTIKYLNCSKLDNILVISTFNTHKSNYFINNCVKKIKSIPLNDLAYMIENNMNFDNYLDERLVIDNQIEAIILGCTHFVKIKDYLIKKHNIEIIDMGKMLADSIQLEASERPYVNLYFSLFNEKLFNNIKNIIKMENVVCQNLLK